MGPERNSPAPTLGSEPSSGAAITPGEKESEGGVLGGVLLAEENKVLVRRYVEET